MMVDLVNMDLFCARREVIEYNCSSGRGAPNVSQSSSVPSNVSFELGGYRVLKQGPSLLTEKCHLKLQVERNLDYLTCHDGNYE